MTDKSTMRRHNEGLLQPFERPTLKWLAERMPRWITPDILTAIGLAGAIITLLGYYLTQRHPLWLLLATAGLVINWFGDSLDGTLARHRKIERPSYGFFVDHTTDLFEQIIISVGIGICGYIHFELAMLGLIVYLLLSVLTFVRAQLVSTLHVSYAGFGPTEMRLGIIVMNLAIIVVPPWWFPVLGFQLSYPNLLSIAWSILGSAVLVSQVMVALRELRRIGEESEAQARLNPVDR